MVAVSQEVIEAGAALIKARRRASKMQDALNDAFDKIDAAFETLPGNPRRMQIGEALNHLIKAGLAHSEIMMAHNSLRKLLGEVGMEEPTDAQINEILDPGSVVIAGGGGGGR